MTPSMFELDAVHSPVRVWLVNCVGFLTFYIAAELLARCSRCRTSTMPGDQLSRLLPKFFAQGDISGTTIHDLAAAAWLDGWGRNCPRESNLVKAGQSGRKRKILANDVIKAAELAGLVCPKASPHAVN